MKWYEMLLCIIGFHKFKNGKRSMSVVKYECERCGEIRYERF